MKISERLWKIASLVPKGARVADIGTDHGYLPIYLAENGLARSVILTDVNAGPLEKARKNIAEYEAGRMGADAEAETDGETAETKSETDGQTVEAKSETGGETAETEAGTATPKEDAEIAARWDLRLGDGLSPIEPGEADVCVIAGMGGRTIRMILEADPEKTRAVSIFLLQPRTEEGMLRTWLRSEGWEISTDALVREGAFLCQIIAVSPPKKAVKKDEREGEPSELETLERALEGDISQLWFSKKEPLAEEYVTRMLRKENAIREALKRSETPESIRKLAKTYAREAALKRLLEWIWENA